MLEVNKRTRMPELVYKQIEAFVAEQESPHEFMTDLSWKSKRHVTSC